MKSQEFGNLLISVFEGYSFKEVVACSKGERLNNLLKEKLGEEKCSELDREDPVVWIDALRMLYFHYMNKQKEQG